MTFQWPGRAPRGQCRPRRAIVLLARCGLFLKMAQPFSIVGIRLRVACRRCRYDIYFTRHATCFIRHRRYFRCASECDPSETHASNCGRGVFFSPNRQKANNRNLPVAGFARIQKPNRCRLPPRLNSCEFSYQWRFDTGLVFSQNVLLTSCDGRVYSLAVVTQWSE